MKKIICFIVNIMILVICLQITVYSENENQKNPISFLVLGDSISTGYGLSGDTYTCKSYGNLEYEYLKDSGCTVTYTNKAVNGHTSADLLRLLSEDSEIISLVRNADIIVYSIGGNDFLGSMIGSIANAVGAEQNLGSVGRILASKSQDDIKFMAEAYLADGTVSDFYRERADRYLENGQKIYNRIKALNPDAEIYMQTLYNPMDNFEVFAPFKSFIEDTITMFNDITKSFEGIYTVLDVFDAFKNHGIEYTNIQSFDIHPNTAGHEVIFSLLKDSVASDVSDSTPVTCVEIDDDEIEKIDNEEIEPLSTTPMVIISSIAIGVIIISFIIAGLQKIKKKR